MSHFQEGIGWRLPGLLYADELVVYGELEEDLSNVEHLFKYEEEL